MPDTEPAAPALVFDWYCTLGSAIGCIRGLPPPTVGKLGVREDIAGAMINRSATDEDGGERGRDVRAGRLPGEPESDSRC